MTRYVALLRGINVGGHATLSMADLRRVMESLDLADVRTYVQSGNAVFSATGAVRGLAKRIEQAIASELDLGITVLLRSRDELAAVIDANPYPEAESTPTQLHVMFLSAMPSAKALSALDTTALEPDRFEPGDRVLYLWLPNGLGRSKLPTYLSERRLGVTATTRNWNTVTKLLALADA